MQPYSLRIYGNITAVFLLLGFAFMATYSHAVIRYSLLRMMLAVIAVFHKQIISVVKNILNLKKN